MTVKLYELWLGVEGVYDGPIVLFDRIVPLDTQIYDKNSMKNS